MLRWLRRARARQPKHISIPTSDLQIASYVTPLPASASRLDVWRGLEPRQLALTVTLRAGEINFVTVLPKSHALLQMQPTVAFDFKQFCRCHALRANHTRRLREFVRDSRRAGSIIFR